MPRKQDRYADKAANQTRINGETIAVGKNVRISGFDRPADVLRKAARYARQRRLEGDAPLQVGIGSFDAVHRAEGN